MSAPRRSPLVHLLVIIVGAECLALAALTVFLLVETVVARPDSLVSALGLAALAAIATAWLAAITVHLRRGAHWTRAAVLTWQVLQIAIAVGGLQGLLPRADVGWYLLVPAVAAIVLLFTPAVVDATRREEPAD